MILSSLLSLLRLPLSTRNNNNVFPMTADVAREISTKENVNNFLTTTDVAGKITPKELLEISNIFLVFFFLAVPFSHAQLIHY